jgi:outer membrane protein OmpA-like peptidoglycan-associated protein
MATSTVTLQVIQRTVLVFDDVHFDFDRSEIRPDGIVILSDAVTKLTANPDIRVTIEGHTDGIGTAEYNIALGQRRATVVHDYLVSRGIAAGRLETVTYGEERPIDDNATAAGRAMNRRAHIVIIMSQ